MWPLPVGGSAGWRLGGSSWSLSAAAASAAAGASSFIMRSQKARDFEGEADGRGRGAKEGNGHIRDCSEQAPPRSSYSILLGQPSKGWDLYMVEQKEGELS